MSRSTREIFLRYWLPLLLYLWLIFSLSSLPLDRALIQIPISDKVRHAAEFLLLPILFFRFLLFACSRVFARYYFWLGVVLAISIALADEIYQSYVPGRTPDFNDFAADLTGIGIVAIGWLIWRRWRKAS